jgi:hypothetical protein
LDKDRKTDLAVFYTLEGFGGGNLYLQYLAIFTNVNGKLSYLTSKHIGGKDNRSISSETAVISNGKIKVNTLEYLRTDASCCPSKKGSAQFILDKGKIKEIK